MSISYKTVLFIAALSAFAFIALILVNTQSQNVSAVIEIEVMILALIVTCAAGFLYVGECASKPRQFPVPPEVKR